MRTCRNSSICPELLDLPFEVLAGELRVAVEIALDVIDSIGVFDDLTFFLLKQILEPVFGDDVGRGDLDE